MRARPTYTCTPVYMRGGGVQGWRSRRVQSSAVIVHARRHFSRDEKNNSSFFVTTFRYHSAPYAAYDLFIAIN